MQLIRVHSHRARRTLKREFGTALGKELFSFHREGEFYWLTDDNAARAIKITGVTRARDTGNLQPCLYL
jgi:hypothetical protein